MKKVILIVSAICLVMCSSCEEPIERQTKEVSIKIIDIKFKNGYSVNIHEYEIDGCQYLGTFGGKGQFLTHKGNCTNNIHSK